MLTRDRNDDTHEARHMLMRPPSGEKVLWQELLRHELEAALTQDPVVIVTVGSIEQHGPHCPQDVDISIPYHLAIRTAEVVDEFPVIVAPPVSLGFTHYNMGEVGTITLSLETFIDVLCDVSRSIWANGVSPPGSAQRTWGQRAADLGRGCKARTGRCLAGRADVLEH